MSRRPSIQAIGETMFKVKRSRRRLRAAGVAHVIDNFVDLSLPDARDELNRLVHTAMFSYSGIGIVAMTITLVAAYYVHSIFPKIPAEFVPTARQAAPDGGNIRSPEFPSSATCHCGHSAGAGAPAFDHLLFLSRHTRERRPSRLKEYV